jgi:uncharacterized membrane protein
VAVTNSHPASAGWSQKSANTPTQIIPQTFVQPPFIVVSSSNLLPLSARRTPYHIDVDGMKLVSFSRRRENCIKNWASMTLLIIGIIAFLGLHLVPTLPGVRGRLVARLGEGPYKGLFALLSIATFIILVYGFAKAPVIQVWSPPAWTRWIAVVLMLPALIFLVAAYVPGQIKAKLKHPFLVAIKTWALAHLIVNGDLASIILFASFLAYAVYDRVTLKGRPDRGLVTVRKSGPPSNDIIAVVLGVILYLAFLFWLHPLLIGSSPLLQ